MVKLRKKKFEELNVNFVFFLKYNFTFWTLKQNWNSRSFEIFIWSSKFKIE